MRCLERRQPEGVATILDAEYAEEERVHSEEDSTPNEHCDLLLARVGHPRDLEGKADGGEGEDTVCKSWSVKLYLAGPDRPKLTHSGDNLCLETELVLEATGEVADTTLAVGSNIRDLANVVEHVTAGEEQDHDQADSSPEVAVLDNGKDVGRGNSQECEDTDNRGGDGDDLNIVDRTLDRRVRRVGKMAAQPCVNGFGLVGTDTIRLLAANDGDADGLETHPERKSNLVGEGSVFALGPVVGWKRSRTGAVCNWS